MTKSSIKERFKPKRRNNNAKSAHNCLDCDLYTPLVTAPCIWKLEANIDAGMQHYLEAIRIIRRLTSGKQRRLHDPILEPNCTATQQK